MRFNFTKKALKGKKIVAFGDSVTADATIGCPKTYPHLIQEKYHMGTLLNYAIGGTTATYMFKGSNIEKEYTLPDKLFAVDGCRVVTKAVENGEVNDASLAFIFYGHNDMFFQEPIDNVEGQGNVLSLDDVKSFKASYRYMVNKLRSVNPSINIVIINCNYSEYDKNAELIYGYKNTYSDYRKAIEEVASELNCFYYDPWDYFEKIFHSPKKEKYYKDFIHLNKKGQKLLFKFLTRSSVT